MSGHAAHHGADHADPANKRIALLIIILAAFLALSETGGKSAQTAALAVNIDVSDTWAFYQARSLRITMLSTQADSLALELPWAPPDRQAAMQKQVDEWRAAADKFESDPATGTGRKELQEAAKRKEAARDRYLSAYHMYEVSSAIFQIAIVFASACVLTQIGLLFTGSLALGGIAIAAGLIGWLAPQLFHI